MNTENNTLASMGQNELAVASSAAQSKALVEAKFTIALAQPRSMANVRQRLLDATKRPAFASDAKYRKPVGGGFVEGPSIRFAEEAIRSMGNIDVATTVLYEDELKRLIRISVTDLESNSTYSDDVTISKTVERKTASLRGRVVLERRKNSDGKEICICPATDDELQNKLNALKSKTIRNSGLRLVPSDLVEEAMASCAKTVAGNGGADDTAKKTVDALSRVGVTAKQLSDYLGHDASTLAPKEIEEIRGIYTAIKDGETTWNAVMEEREIPAKTKPKFGEAVEKKEKPAKVVAVKDPEPEEIPDEVPTQDEPTPDDIEKFAIQQRLKTSLKGQKPSAVMEVLKAANIATEKQTKFDELSLVQLQEADEQIEAVIEQLQK